MQNNIQHVSGLWLRLSTSLLAATRRSSALWPVNILKRATNGFKKVTKFYEAYH